MRVGLSVSESLLTGIEGRSECLCVGLVRKTKKDLMLG